MEADKVQLVQGICSPKLMHSGHGLAQFVIPDKEKMSVLAK